MCRNYGNRIKRKIGEALLINELKPSLNKQDFLNVYLIILNKVFCILIVPL